MTDHRAELDLLLVQLEELKKRHAEEFVSLRAKVDERYDAWVSARYGVGKGDRVILPGGCEAIVESVYRSGYYRCATPWLTVRKKTKSGFAKNTCTAYNWKKLCDTPPVPTPPPPPDMPSGVV